MPPEPAHVTRARQDVGLEILHINEETTTAPDDNDNHDIDNDTETVLFFGKLVAAQVTRKRMLTMTKEELIAFVIEDFLSQHRSHIRNLQS